MDFYTNSKNQNAIIESISISINEFVGPFLR